jgi:phosphohistidine phosphatase
MDIYLMQHGVAAAEADDPARPLTDAGRAAVTRVAIRAQAARVSIDRFLHSGKLRAEQTAQIVAAALGTASIEARDGLAPNDPVAPIADWLRNETDAGSLALVGHLPFLDRLASLLIADDQDTQVIAFQNAGLVALVPKPDRAGFAVGWVLTPEIA